MTRLNDATTGDDEDEDLVDTFFLGTGTDYGSVTSPDTDRGLPIVVTPQSASPL